MTASPDRTTTGQVFGTWAVVGFSAIWLVFLADPISTAWAARHTTAGIIGLIATCCVALLYLAAWLVQIRPGWVGTWVRGHPVASGSWSSATPAARARSIAVIAVQLVLAAVMIATLGQPATAALPFVGVLMMLWLPRVVGPVGVVLLVAAVGGLEWAVPGWQPGFGVPLSIAASALAVWGIQTMRQRTRALMDARAENARLAVAEERHRMARDLHDVLGHSLTVITVKIELAGRLLDVDPDRARTELAGLERLSRDTLHDVRRAVEGYRDLSLAGELVRAREALESADILAHLPSAVDEVPTQVRDLYAWAVREGITNVIRHSGASTCTVQVTPERLTIVDDGAGPGVGVRSRGAAGQVGEGGGLAGPVAETGAVVAGAGADAGGYAGASGYAGAGADAGQPGGGNGLRGLVERARLAGAVILTREVDPHGFELTVQVQR
ncbi:sensor histidine kinase [Ruania zhangjianzhongii]|uniref:sensor histidine kinase n=1 Tax=Ruania zhangjianzhongii TaxID=2603206 RepID=UPI0011CC970E|nr:histidine kinase [Ruania zhangjianzhongii]